MADSNRELGELTARVEGLREGFLDFRTEMRGSFGELNQTIKERLDTHSMRLGRLERWRSFIAGSLAALAALWAMIKGILPIFWTPRP